MPSPLSDKLPDVGAMRQWISWEQQTVTQDSVGQEQPTWSTVVSCWAHTEPMRGMELYNARQLKGGTWYKVRVRNLGAVTPNDRFIIVATSQILNVESVFAEDARNAYLIIHCIEQLTPSEQ
jgi:SPP1 family predicted phage head-tail adaptor